MLQEIHRLLRPGGLFLSVEWEVSTDNLEQGPHLEKFLDLTRQAFSIRGLQEVPVNVLRHVQQHGGFTGITFDPWVFPLGGGHDGVLGRHFAAEIFSRYMDSVETVLTDMEGVTCEYIEYLYAQVRQELDTEAFHILYRTVWARKA